MVNHPAIECPYCGREIKRNSGISPGSTFYGDRSYIDWAGHKCNPIKKFFHQRKKNKQYKRLKNE